MSVINSQPLIGASGNQGVAGYNLTNSLRFRSSASAYLSRTPAGAGNRRTWTWSGWVKRGTLGVETALFTGYSSVSVRVFAGFESGNTLQIYGDTGGINIQTSAVFRDPSAWYHIVIAFDTTQATSTNRIKLYVNGVQQTTSGTFPNQNTDWAVNNTNAHYIASSNGSSIFSDLYTAELNFVDGQALTPADFGETSATTGVWIPKAYTGTYGTNGFYLPFTNNASTTTIGYDFSGNGNNWTSNNISLTAGSNYDSMTDVPTLTNATTANYCVLNPANQSTNATLSEANLSSQGTSANYAFSQATFALNSEKWYFEVQKNSATQFVDGVCLVTSTFGKNTSSTITAGNYSISDDNTNQVRTITNGGTPVLVSTSNWANSDIIQCAYDADTGKIWFGCNGSWYPATNGGTVGDPATDTNPTITGVSGLVPAMLNYNTGSILKVNFGQRPFSYTPPTGFVALNTFNLPTPTIGATASTQANKYFDAKLYTGTGSSLSVTGYGFSPDFVWIKERSGAADHALYDAVRGVQIQLESNTTTAETTETTGLTALNSDGFTVGSLAQVNTNTDTYVAWAWDANGAGSSNTSGTITSTVSANTSAGFSVVTYTGTGSAATIGHGLGVAPSMVIVKNRDAADAWQVYHAANTAAPETDYLVLNTTAATADAADRWNDTLPTSTVFSIGNGVEVNTNTEKYVAYCFAEVAGYSKFASYTGNGSADGPFVFTGFRPKFVLVKISSGATENWYIFDSVRNTYNPESNYLAANSSFAENAGGSPVNCFDFLSNGFKVINSGTFVNGNTYTYIYMAFAETPQKFALGR
jgi:hypothetical protein